jgi:hypothetical protein
MKKERAGYDYSASSKLAGFQQTQQIAYKSSVWQMQMQMQMQTPAHHQPRSL